MILRSLIPLAILADAATIVHSSYMSSETCSSPPETIWVFDNPTPDINSVPRNDTYWPFTYYIWNPTYPYIKCGNLNGNVAMTGDCCTSLLYDHGTTLGYQSFTSHYLDMPTNALKSLPLAANGSTYCFLSANAGSTQPIPSLLGNRHIMFLASGVCVEDGYVCHPNGTLFVYEDYNCQGARETFNLDKTAKLINSEVLGSARGSMVKVCNGVTSIGWVEYIPGAFLVPRNKNVAEILEMILLIMSILISLASIVYSGREWWRQDTKNHLFLLCCHILWTIWIIYRVAYIYIVFSNSETLAISSYALGIIFNFASLANTFYTAFYLLSVFSLSPTNQYLLYGSLLFLHIFLAGEAYAYYFLSVSQPAWYYWTWTALSPYWITIMYIFDLFPAIWFVTVMFPAKMTFTAKFRIQLVIIGVYYLTSYIGNFTPMLQSDRNYLASSSILAVCLTLHSLLNCFLIESTRNILKKIKSSTFLETKSSRLSKSQSLATGGRAQPVNQLPLQLFPHFKKTDSSGFGSDRPLRDPSDVDQMANLTSSAVHAELKDLDTIHIRGNSG
ncbi:hypothetical protein HDU91_004123 [Kappamyces sp. JEL0680]|nr:hypothetical protein HDU91_004123 [Kappamyces sp. JEL0680]